jgi:hypothetical protein
MRFRFRTGEQGGARWPEQPKGSTFSAIPDKMVSLYHSGFRSVRLLYTSSLGYNLTKLVTSTFTSNRNKPSGYRTSYVNCHWHEANIETSLPCRPPCVLSTASRLIRPKYLVRIAGAGTPRAHTGSQANSGVRPSRRLAIQTWHLSLQSGFPS